GGAAVAGDRVRIVCDLPDELASLCVTGPEPRGFLDGRGDEGGVAADLEAIDLRDEVTLSSRTVAVARHRLVHGPGCRLGPHIGVRRVSTQPETDLTERAAAWEGIVELSTTNREVLRIVAAARSGWGGLTLAAAERRISRRVE